jgi:membrane protein
VERSPEGARAAAFQERAGRTLDWARRRVPGADATLVSLEHERRVAAGLLAGGLAYRFFLWLVPFGLLTAALLSEWVEHDDDGLEDTAREFGIGAVAAKESAKALAAGDRNRLALGLTGLVFTAYFSLGAARALRIASGIAWNVEVPRMRRPLHVIAVFNGILVLATLGSLALQWLRAEIGVGALLGATLGLALETAIALAVLWLLPHRASRPRELLPGAFVIAVGVAAVQVAVVFYFAPRLGRSTDTYGSLGAAVTMLVWLYVLARLLTSSMFLNATLWERRRAQAEAGGAV